MLSCAVGAGADAELMLMLRCGGSGVEVTVELACGSMSDMAMLQQLRTKDLINLPSGSRILPMNKRALSFLVLLLGLNILAASDDKGVCPPAPPKPKAVPAESVPPQLPPSPDAKFAGTVSLLAVISDKGYVCSVQLIRGFDKAADTQAIRAVRKWHFDPARKDGHPVPVVVKTEVNFWRNASGQLVSGTPNQSAK